MRSHWLSLSEMNLGAGKISFSESTSLNGRDFRKLRPTEIGRSCFALYTLQYTFHIRDFWAEDKERDNY